MLQQAHSLASLAARLASHAEGHPFVGLQKAGIKALEDGLNWPAKKADAWRHTSVAPWAEHPWVLPVSPAGRHDATVVAEAIASGVVVPRADSPTLYFVDGRFVPDSSFVPHASGVTLAPWDTNAASSSEPLQRLGTLRLHEQEAFAAFNTATSTSGAVVTVGAGQTVDASVEVVFLTTEACTSAILQPRVLVVAEAQAEVSVSESHVHLGAGVRVWNNAVTEVFAGAGSHVTHSLLQLGSSAGLDVSHVAARVARDARLSLCSLDMGSQLQRRGVRVDLAESGAQASMVHLSLARQSQHHDTQSVVRHQAPHTQSRQQFRAIAREAATSVFGGMVQVEPGAQKIDANQLSRGLVEGRGGAQVLLQPQLIIDADDVKCSHGATVGQLDEEALFYLRSRGFGAADARELLNLAYLGEVLGLLPLRVGAPFRHRAARWLGIDPSAAAAVMA